MFQHFFRAYKDTVYKGAIHNYWSSPILAKILIGVIVVLFLAVGVFATLNNTTWIMFSFLGIFLAMIIIFSLEFHYEKKNREDLYQKYKDKKLQPLLDLLQHDDFSLYSLEKVNWLISCCESRLDKKNNISASSENFSKYFFPIITLLFGVALKEMSSEGAIQGIVLILVGFAAFWGVKYIIDEISNPNREVLKFLKTELEYIKTEF